MVRRVEIAGREISLCGPANYNDLPDDERVARRFAIDEYMPYWADLWPGAVMLAEEVARWPSPSADDAVGRVLDLGCGLGLVGLVAAQRGFQVTCADYDEDALSFVKLSARLNGYPAPETRLVDWRERYADARWDRILAADLLYETRNLAPIVDFIAAHLSDDGQALLSDPNRSTAEAFESIARHSGFRVDVLPRITDVPWLPAKRVPGRIFVLRRTTPGSEK